VEVRVVYFGLLSSSMRIVEGPFWIDVAPDLLVRTLDRASREAGDSLREEYVQEREAVSGIETVDIREASERELDARWVERLELLNPLRRALIEVPALRDAVAGCVLYAARQASEEGMLLEPDGHPASGVLTLRLAPETLLSLAALRRLLSNGNETG